MQISYLAEIQTLFDAPLVAVPLLDREVRGLDVVGEVATMLFGDGRQQQTASGREVTRA